MFTETRPARVRIDNNKAKRECLRWLRHNGNAHIPSAHGKISRGLGVCACAQRRHSHRERGRRRNIRVIHCVNIQIEQHKHESSINEN